MIPFSSQRGLGQDLATHLLNEHDNEVMELVDLRGSVADDLHGAFAEWELQAHYLTKCERYLYSLSVNPDPRQPALSQDQYFDYINRIEEKLGLSGQPRAVVFHTKHDRTHAHVVWSRINLEQEKAIQLSHDRPKLMDVTKEFARDHGLYLPDGYYKDGNEKSQQNSLYEQHQQNTTGITKAERMKQVTEAWKQSDSAKAFVHALREKGYILATGKRPYVLVDIYGEMNALPKLISDKQVRTKDIRSFLVNDYPVEKLPSVEAARAEAAKHRQALKERTQFQSSSSRREQLAHAQAHRREPHLRKLDALKKLQVKEKQSLKDEQANIRQAYKNKYQGEQYNIRLKRYAIRPTGLAEFLGRISGVNLIRKKMHEHQDNKARQQFEKQRDELFKVQSQQLKEQDHSHKLKRADLERKLRGLDKVERRENKSLARSLLQEERIISRANITHMPPFRKPNVFEKSQNISYRGEPLGHAFDSAKRAKVPLALGKKLKADFGRASDEGEQDDGRGGDNTGTPEPTILRKDNKPRQDRNRDIDDDIDRGR